jgi:hypothetical protein
MNCEFAEVKCDNKNCDCEGCDCETLQDKLDELKENLQTDTEKKYKDIIAKIAAIPQPVDNKDLLLLIKNLINDVKKGVLVALHDGDENTIIDNKTTEILLLLSELREIITEMKYCENPELTAELKELVASTTKELHTRREADIKKQYPELSDGIIKNNAELMHENHSVLTPHSIAQENFVMSDEVAIVEENWYDATIEKLLTMIDFARK